MLCNNIYCLNFYTNKFKLKQIIFNGRHPQASQGTAAITHQNMQQISMITLKRSTFLVDSTQNILFIFHT